MCRNSQSHFIYGDTFVERNICSIFAIKKQLCVSLPLTAKAVSGVLFLQFITGKTLCQNCHWSKYFLDINLYSTS